MTILLCLVAALALALAVLSGAYVCYRLAFSVPKERDLFKMPDSAQYRPYNDRTAAMLRRALATPYEEVWITSREGLRLYGRYYAVREGAPVQLMFHGYRSAAERDFCGGLQEAIDRGFNVLLVDQRGHGKSEGKCLTMGVMERYDCLAWAEYAAQRFGRERPLLLYGMSMGAATVLMAAGLPLPQSVVGIVADCGYTSPAAIIKSVLIKRGYPLFPTYFLTRLGGRIFGGFDLESASALEAMEHCHCPVLFIHGDDDHFVPCAMGRENYARCASANKHLLIVPTAGHGLSYMVDRTAYMQAVAAFLDSVLKK